MTEEKSKGINLRINVNLNYQFKRKEARNNGKQMEMPAYLRSIISSKE